MLTISLGTWTMLPDDNSRPTMNVDFIDDVAAGTTHSTTPNRNMPNRQSCLCNPDLAPGVMGDGPTQLSWTHMDLNFSGADLLFLSEKCWNPGNQGQERGCPPYSCSNSRPNWHPRQELQEPLSTLPNYTLQEGEFESLARFPKPKATWKLQHLLPKSTSSSLGHISSSNGEPVASQRKRKLGYRDGPLGAEAREGASKMRQIGACLTCKLRKTKVSQRKAFNRSLTENLYHSALASEGRYATIAWVRKYSTTHRLV